MSRLKSLFALWKSDYDFKTVTAAMGSLAATTVFALYNGFLGASLGSLWHGTICVYYIVLVVLRGFIIAARQRAPRKGEPERAKGRAFVASAALLLFLNICLVIPVSMMVIRQKPVQISLIPAIGLAAYTTYKIIMASVNLRRRRFASDPLVRLLRTIGFIDALVSILTLQNTLIMVNEKEGSAEMLTLSALTSAAVMLTVLALSVAAMVQGTAGLKRASHGDAGCAAGDPGPLPDRRNGKTPEEAASDISAGERTRP